MNTNRFYFYSESIEKLLTKINIFIQAGSQSPFLCVVEYNLNFLKIEIFFQLKFEKIVPENGLFKLFIGRIKLYICDDILTRMAFYHRQNTVEKVYIYWHINECFQEVIFGFTILSVKLKHKAFRHVETLYQT